MKRERLREIRQRLGAITPGEWLPTATGDVASDCSGEEHPTFVCAVQSFHPSEMAEPDEQTLKANRRFICYAPEDIGYLLRVIDSLIERGFGPAL